MMYIQSMMMMLTTYYRGRQYIINPYFRFNKNHFSLSQLHARLIYDKMAIVTERHDNVKLAAQASTLSNT